MQIDLLENPAIEDVVVLSVVLDEVKNKNLSVYNRLKALCTNTARRFFVFTNEHHRYAVLNSTLGSPKSQCLFPLVGCEFSICYSFFRS
jgi:exosome complex exonuclease DIS3/RRP44